MCELLILIWFRISSRFDKTVDLNDVGFTDISEWSVCKESVHRHSFITENSDFKLNKPENFCNVARTKAEEREFWTDNVHESLKKNESVISRCQPSDDPHKKAVEDRTHNPKQLYRNAKVKTPVLHIH